MKKGPPGETIVVTSKASTKEARTRTVATLGHVKGRRPGSRLELAAALRDARPARLTASWSRPLQEDQERRPSMLRRFPAVVPAKRLAKRGDDHEYGRFLSISLPPLVVPVAA